MKKSEQIGNKKLKKFYKLAKGHTKLLTAIGKL